MTDLRFIGDWKLWAGLTVGVLLAVGAWLLYWRETRRGSVALRWLLPTLRALVLFFIVMMLTGPVLHHRKTIGELARVLLFVDASGSMAVTDDQMELPRKLLAARQLGWLPAERLDVNLKDAADHLAAAQQLAAGAKSDLRPADAKALAVKVANEVEAAFVAFAKLKPDIWPDASTEIPKLRAELLAPAQKLAGLDTPGDPKKLAAELTALLNPASRWEKELRQVFTDHVTRASAGRDEPVRSALRRFDAMPRWQRLETYLLGGQESLLARLASQHNIELTALAGSQPEILWWPGSARNDPQSKLPQSLALTPTNHTTDLSSAIKSRVEDIKESERIAVVLFSDGQHNDGPSPLEISKTLGHRGVAVFTVGFGMEHLPRDLAVLDVKGPDTVFADARVRGEVVLKDDMKPGLSFALKVQRQGETLWEKSLTTEQKHQRSVEFDFSIKDLVARSLKQQDKDLKFSSLPMQFQVSASALEGEKDTNNNVGTLRVAAITQKPKLLILDGRPRWEFRYLRNLFERDDRWEVNALLAGGGGEQKPWTRGPLNGQFPRDKETLFGYQLICFGDLPPNQLKPEELDWIKEFVERRAGGVVFIDGRQERLASYAPSALGPLFPVKWPGAAINDAQMRLKLEASGSAASPLTLASDPLENAKLWASLPAPHNVAGAEALPGAETLLSVASGAKTVPAMVFRRYGAGRVLYTGFDESWRWRYNVGDLYHQRFWNQIAKWIMEAPFPVQDKFVSLDSGSVNYRSGQAADLRVRLRDEQGRLMLKAAPEAWLFRDGQRVAAIALAPDDNEGGIYRGKTSALAEGNYEVRVHVDGLPESEMKARTEFTVAPQGNAELAQLNCDEELLRQIAFNSGGQYYREEEIGALAERLKPLSQGRVVESDTLLWQSWWWFTPLVLLLTIEWVLRKRAGML